ncbi:MerR family transcriptional regulator [Nocardiopsis sp. MG754419]|uniref:MerR family transcriptional regulator n=1 Tax=Nocardiopsis sp. MG754419 TaxID=2259865 RepID=UPI0027DCF5B0|nr:MerR family transcriptional regulator [Nocardiopsis sp. MG754419]
MHEGRIDEALESIDAAHADLHRHRGDLRRAGEALAAIAHRTANAPAPPRGDLRIGEVAAHLGVRASALRVWEEAGLLGPERDRATGYRTYTPADVRLARVVHLLRQVGYPLAGIGPVLEQLNHGGDTTALDAALARRTHDLNRRSRAMLDAAAHLNDYLTHP